jgi:hypothetical protein
VTRELLQCFRSVRGGGCALILTFFLLPYLVDVAYYGDFTPTHSAQESVDTKNEVDRFEYQKSLLCADDQAYSGGDSFRLQDVGTRCSSPANSVAPPHYLFVASHTSRPPPTL